MSRRSLSAAVLVAGVLTVAMAACGDDDDAATTTTESVPETTEPATTSSTSSTSTTDPPPTTSAEDALKAEIAEDFLRAEQAVEDLLRAPTVDDLDASMALIAVPGSFTDTSLRETVNRMVAAGERLVPGDPDHSTVTIEEIELSDGPSSTTAVVTMCFVTNQMVVQADGTVVSGGPLYAARLRQPMALVTALGWRESDQSQRVDIAEGDTCA